MAKNPTPSKGAPEAGQQQEAKSDQATNTSASTTAAAPATGGELSPSGESSNGADNAGNSTGSSEHGPALNTQADALGAVTASPPAGAVAADNSATADELVILQEQPAKQAYTVTGRFDVLHDGKLYTEGEPIYLDQDGARPLLNNRCITPTGGTQ
jgi:hypothetical protein